MLPQLAQAALQIGRAATPYSATWSQARPSGDGVSAARTITAVGSITGYVVQQQPNSLAVALAGANIPKASWWLITTASVAIGDTITNAGGTFTIETVDRISSVYQCRLSIGGATV